MTHRAWGVVLVLVLLVIAIEIAVRSYSPAKGVVMILNGNDEPMDDVTLTYAGARVEMGRLPPGGSAHAYFTAGPLGPLAVEFNQEGNPLKIFEIADYDPDRNRRDRFKLVLTVKNGQVERMTEDSQTTTPWDRITDTARDWFDSQTRMAR